MTDPSTDLKRTPLYDLHVRDGGKMVAFAGYEMPVQYKAGLVGEHHAVRNAGGLFDVSHMGELSLKGPKAGELVNGLITNDASKLVDGKALYTCACNDKGTILDDLIVYRAAADRWLIVCNASNREKIVGHVGAAARGVCDFEDISDATALIAFQGPKAVAIASRLASSDLSSLGSFSFVDTTIAGVTCTASRTGYTAEDGLEIFCENASAPKLWDALLTAGRDEGVLPIGLGARDTLRLEGRLSLYGNDIDETTNPLEAGLAWVVKLDKPEFVGKQALVAIKEKGLERRLVGFEMTGRGIARHGYPLLDKDGATVGICTSGSPGPTVGKNIGLGYLPTAMTAVGTEFVVDCRGRKAEAVVVKTPFYKRKAS
ncbi:MAG: glycine cleavage system aminomethyltransferase GcvT [Polyangiaceae bacterium]|nr:glycine cleavage system aminomethyltransferase GcvT [Polyangiaceae bacterium]